MNDPAWREAVWPSQDARDKILAEGARLVADRLHALASERQITPVLDQSAIRARLADFNFEAPRDTSRVARDVAELLDVGLVQSAHARCFGLFNPTPALPGIVADLLAAAWNPQLAVWSHAPAAVEIELHALSFVASHLEIDTELGASHFTSGGSESNGSALTVALTRRFRTFAAFGARSLDGQPRLYASAESHLAWLKLVHQSGIGRNALRLIGVDARGRMDTAQLSVAIADDMKIGNIPTLIIATAGTTNAGAIDPLIEIADIASACDAHFHVDAAWAGAIVFSPAKSPLLTGIQRADSVTIDAHKWFGAPMGAGMFFCRHKRWLTDAYHVATDYMPTGAPAEDFYTQSSQWSRRFIGLRLFMILAALGRDGIAAQIEHQFAMGNFLKQRLEATGWRVINDTPLPVLCFADAAGVESEKVLRNALADGSIWISSTRTQGRACLRACITSFLTEPSDIETLIAVLSRAREAAL